MPVSFAMATMASLLWPAPMVRSLPDFACVLCIDEKTPEGVAVVFWMAWRGGGLAELPKEDQTHQYRLQSKTCTLPRLFGPLPVRELSLGSGRITWRSSD